MNVLARQPTACGAEDLQVLLWVQATRRSVHTARAEASFEKKERGATGRDRQRIGREWSARTRDCEWHVARAGGLSKGPCCYR